MNTFLKTFDENFLTLHESSVAIINKIPAEKLFWNPQETRNTLSCAEYILRSAGAVEQTFGGITTRLWDDPFEWALPEELSTNDKILSYLDEVEATRLKGFSYFKSDDDLRKELPAPEKIISIFELLLNTLLKSTSLQNDARRGFETLSSQ